MGRPKSGWEKIFYHGHGIDDVRDSQDVHTTIQKDQSESLEIVVPPDIEGESWYGRRVLQAETYAYPIYVPSFVSISGIAISPHSGAPRHPQRSKM